MTTDMTRRSAGFFSPATRWRNLAACFASVLFLSSSAGHAAEYRLAPYKDELFANPPPFKTLYDGHLEMVEYSSERYLDGRDEIPEKKAKAEYVSLDTQASEQSLTMTDGRVRTFFAAAGDTEKPHAIVIFLHGRDADHKAGFSDWTFGGNFNRIKNLMVRNGGVYVSPSFSDFREGGKRQIAGIMEALTRNAPKAPVFLACASAASALCTALAEDASIAPMIGGVLLLGSGMKDVEAAARVYAGNGRRIPIFIGHGTKDPIVNWVRMELFLKEILASSPDYPIRFRLFVSGYHGTPMRMVDWREVINWMLAQRAG